MDNRVFNVNGSGDSMLLKALQLAFIQEGGGDAGSTCKGWIQTKEHGLILLWWESDNGHTFPSPMTAEQVFPIVAAWLQGEFAKTVVCTGWDANEDHDGDNSVGWRVYWGHVGPGSHSTICAVKPAFMWHGK